MSKDGDEFSGAIDRLEKLVTGLSQDRDPIGDGHHVAGQRNRVAGRPARPGAAAVGRHGRPVEPAGATARRATRTASTPRSSACPGNYRKLARLGSYGAFFPYYICGITFRASDLQGRTVGLPLDQARDRKVRGKLMLEDTADPNSSRPASSASS